MATPQSAARPEATAALSDEALVEINRLWTIVRAFSNLAHDVNNALQVVSGSAELLASGDLDQVARRRVEAVRTKAAEAATAIGQLLSYARDDGAPTARAADVTTLVQTAVAMRSATLGRARIAVTVDQSTREPCRVTADRNSILQLLLNLLLHAEEMLQSGGGGQIAVRTGREAAGVVVAVEARPSGPGREGQASLSEVTAMTTGTELWTASRLAGDARGLLEVTSSGATGVMLKLTLPVA